MLREFRTASGHSEPRALRPHASLLVGASVQSPKKFRYLSLESRVG